MVAEQHGILVIEHFANLDYVLLEPALRELQESGGLSVELHSDAPISGRRGEMGGLALLDTVVRLHIPTLILTAALTNVGKDLYGTLKRGFSAIWKKLHDTSDPGYSDRFSMKLSAIVELSGGRRAKLLLAPSCGPKHAEIAFASCQVTSHSWAA